VRFVSCNGKLLEVREAGPVIFRLTARDVPIKPAGGLRLMEDSDARALLRRLIDSELYEGGRVD
jgi:hypothetical protein